MSDTDRVELEVIAQDPKPGEARVRVPETPEIGRHERQHATHSIMRELGSDARDQAPETVVGYVTFCEGFYEGFEPVDETGTDRPSTLSEFATDGGDRPVGAGNSQEDN